MTKLKEGNVAAASELFQVEGYEKTSKQHWFFFVEEIADTT